MDDKNREDFAHDLFGPVIFSYTDVEAVEDGVLFDVAKYTKRNTNRVTASVYGWLGGNEKDENFEPRYRGLEDAAHNAFVKSKDKELVEFNYNDQRFWFMDNETGGKTIMFPEDY